MPPTQKRYRFGSHFEGAKQESREVEHWYDIDWYSCANVKTVYILSASSSFVLLFVYGAMCINVTESCRVVESSGRCCRCLSTQETVPPALQQTMPREWIYNDVYYGVVMMMSACFGLTYMYLGISQENRFLFFCMFATQGIEVLRGLLDAALEPPEHSSRRLARQIVLGLAAFLMLVSWSLVRRMYKLFGWRIFRRGGARRAVREMYKTYQRYRACNLLDVQASVLLFAVLAFFVQSVRKDGFWVFIFVFLCELTASRYAVKYLKCEDYYGVALSAVCKLVALFWWTMSIAEYASCWHRFQKSRDGTRNWWLAGFFPKLDSVASYYAGQECRPDHTAYEDRVVELLAINYAFAVIFRIASLVIGVKVVQNFGKGMRSVFYPPLRTFAADMDDATAEDFTTTGNGDVFEDSNGDISQPLKEASQRLMDA